MDTDIFFGILGFIGEAIVVAYNSKWFLVFKFFAGIYTFVLFVDLVLLLFLRGLKTDIRVGLKGAQVPTGSKGKFMKKWSEILTRMESGNISQFKAAILEADSIIDDVLRKIGYAGENMTERLASVSEIQIENIHDLRRAHEIRNKIIQDENYVISTEEAKEVLGIYENYLKEIELL